MNLSAKQAAKSVGKSVTTITRAIKSGRISASKTEAGGYKIEPSELFRVFPPIEEIATGATGVSKSEMLPLGTPAQSSVSEKVSAKGIGALRDQLRDLAQLKDQERAELIKHITIITVLHGTSDIETIVQQLQETL